MVVPPDDRPASVMTLQAVFSTQIVVKPAAQNKFRMEPFDLGG